MNRFLIGLAAIGVGISTSASLASAANPASDNAADSVYFNFPNPDGLNGLNGGTGFGPWTTSKSIIGGSGNPTWPGFAGWFQAYGNVGAPGNPDLQDIGTVVPGQPGRPAWGSYANSTQPTGGVAMTSATRAFTGGELQPGQTFTAEFEHGNVSFYPPIFELRTFGWVGIVLHSSPSYGADVFANGLGFGGVVGFGFNGGQTTYQIVTPGQPSFDTGIPFTQRGLRVAFERTSSTDMTINVTKLDNNQQWSFVRPVSGIMSGFGLINRYAREANVYFNNISVTGTPIVLTGACCAGATCVISTADACTGLGSGFSGPGSVCSPTGSFTTPCCFADADRSGAVNVDDIFVFLNFWFASDAKADIDGVSGVGIDDIFVYLNAWFAGC